MGYLRLHHIIGDKKKGIPPIIPVSKSTWWDGVKKGRYPQPVKHSPRVTVWRVEDIRNLAIRMGIAKVVKATRGVTTAAWQQSFCVSCSDVLNRNSVPWREFLRLSRGFRDEDIQIEWPDLPQ